jgi:hypothetical protein
MSVADASFAAAVIEKQRGQPRPDSMPSLLSANRGRVF